MLDSFGGGQDGTTDLTCHSWGASYVQHSLTFPRSGDLGTWHDWKQSDSSTDPTAWVLPLYRAYRSFSLHVPEEAHMPIELAR